MFFVVVTDATDCCCMYELVPQHVIEDTGGYYYSRRAQVGPVLLCNARVDSSGPGLGEPVLVYTCM